MDDTLHIRSFASHDQDAARGLILQGLGEHFGFIDETLNPDLDDISAYYLASGHLFLVAERRQTLVGTGALLLQPAATGELVRISTHSAYRRLGIARAICLHLIEYAHQLKLRTLIVKTNLGWDGAIKLYQRLGFVEYRRSTAGLALALDLSLLS
ncbi:MAG: GNAT family N-acetyltransferase [Ktedonobacteraceae bacterium]